MIIDFSKMNEDIRQNARGGEGEFAVRMFADEHNRILYGSLTPGSSLGAHTHETDSETMYFLQGTGKVLYDGQYLLVKAGMCHYCAKGKSHSLINDGKEDLVFFAVIPTHK